MLGNKDYQELFQFETKVAKTLKVYKKTKEIYMRSKYVLGRIPAFSVTFSSTQVGEVSYGTSYSTKIYTSK